MKSEIILEKLKTQVGDPEWPERLVPLFLFKGTKPSRIHTLWNVAHAMYLCESESISYGIKLLNTQKSHYHSGKAQTYLHWDGPPNEIGHFCGLHSSLQSSSLRGIFARLRGSKELTDSISPAFTEYVEYVHPMPCYYERVPQQSNYTKLQHLAWWRTPREHKRRGRKAILIQREKKPAWYMQDAPSILNRLNVSADIALMQHIHSVLPRGLPHDIRDDLCQDLLVAVLSGETSVSNLPEMMNKYARLAKSFLPERGKMRSIDAKIKGTDDLKMLDIIGADHEHF